MEKKSTRGGKRENAGRPKKEARVKKQIFINADLVERLKGYSADELNTLLDNATRPNINSLQGFETSHKIAEVEVKYQPNRFSEIAIDSPDKAHEMLLAAWSDRIEWSEEFLLILLNNQNQPLGFVKLFSGGLNELLVDTRLIFQVALVAAASSIIVSHNHPSGKLSPSKEDIDITKRIYEISKLIGIQLIDHIIVSKTDFYSFRQNGYIY